MNKGEMKVLRKKQLARIVYNIATCAEDKLLYWQERYAEALRLIEQEQTEEEKQEP